MDLVLIQQPVGSTLCGQACLAMILKVPLEKVVKDLKESMLKPQTMINYLHSHRFHCFWALKRVYKNWTNNIIERACAIVKMKESHARTYRWVIYNQNKIYDPGSSGLLEEFPGAPTSFLMVWPDYYSLYGDNNGKE